MNKDLKDFSVIVLIVVFLIFGLFSFVYFGSCIYRNISQNNICTAFDGDRLIFQGKAYLIRAEAKGATTQVEISNGLFIHFPYKFYVSDKIKITCE